MYANFTYVSQLLLGALLTVVGIILFTDSIELLGVRLGLTTSITGAVISPLLTCLPELFVFITAVFLYGGRTGEDVGLGTVIGEPFMASTIAYPLLVLASVAGYLTKRRKDYTLRPGREVALPFLVVTLLFPALCVPTLLPLPLLKYAVGSIMLSSYFIYVLLSTRMGVPVSEIVDKAPELTLLRFIKSERAALCTQLLISAITIVSGSRLLVESIIALSKMLNISAQAISIIIVPSVTALPESLTGLIWAYRGRDTLAIASIVGEEVLHSTFYPGIAMFTTHAELNLYSLYCVVVTVVISLLMLYYVYRGKVGFEIAVLGLSGYIAYVLMVLLYARLRHYILL